MLLSAYEKDYPVLHHSSANLSRYVMLSLLLHLLFIAWGLYYLRLTSRLVHSDVPVRVTIAAPALPTGPFAGIGDTPSAPVLLQEPPATPDLTPPAPTPLVIAMATAPPPPPTPTPTLQTRQLEPLAPLATVAIPKQFPDLPPSPLLRRPSESPPPPTVPAALPSPAVFSVPEPVHPPVSTAPPPQPIRPLDEHSTPELVAVPHPAMAQRVPSLRDIPQPSPLTSPSPPIPNTQVPEATGVPTMLLASPISPVSIPTSAIPRKPDDIPPTPLPADMLPSLPPTPSPAISPAPDLQPTIPLHVSAALSLPTAPPPPITRAVFPPTHLPRRSATDTHPFEVVATPPLSRPNPGPFLPPREGSGKALRTARRQTPVETPPHFIYQPKPPYPRIARQRGWEGTVILNIEMLADGTVGDIKVAKSSGYPLLDAAAKRAVRRWRHMPEKRHGVAVTRRAILPFHWRLK